MSQADLAVVGMGVMGAALARNFRSRGLTVALYNRSFEHTQEVLDRHGAEGFVPCHTYAEVVASLKAPRKVILMVTAGKVVDLVLDDLVPLLTEGDIVVDAGNSHYADTERRIQRAEAAPWRFLGMGVSGGERGALEGPSMMPGGDRVAYEALKPHLEAAAATSNTGPCVTYCGEASAGHFVKMVHNGIEYGDMQLIAECTTLLRQGLGLSAALAGEAFATWNQGLLDSYLVEITAGILATPDPQGDGPLVDQILDVAGQKGTGRWTSIAATELGVPIPTITAAVDARGLSAMHPVRQRTAEVFPSAAHATLDLEVSDIEAALYVAKVMSYTQGFDLLRRASEERGYHTDLAAVARIWKEGCIIRAAFLDDVWQAFTEQPALPLLFLAEPFTARVLARQDALRRVVAAATLARIPVPALSASLAYLDTLSTARGSASLIQAQRDWFGAHTYKRRDAPEVSVHTEWDGAV